MSKRRALKVKTGDTVRYAGRPYTVAAVYAEPRYPESGPFPPYFELHGTSHPYSRIVVTYKIVR